MRLFWCAIVLPLGVCASFAAAAQITFVHGGTGSGTFNGVPFTNKAFRFTAIGDTSDRAIRNTAYYIVHSSPAVFDLASFGSYEVNIPTRTFFQTADSTPGISMGASGYDIFNGPENSALMSGWDMLSSIGPISSTNGFVQSDSIPTSGGELRFNDSATLPVTFTATVIPEPASLGGMALASVALFRRHRSAQRKTPATGIQDNPG